MQHRTSFSLDLAYSEKLIQRVSEKTKQIAKSPFIFQAAGHKDYRVATLGNFSIYYRVETDEIIITAFWDNRQDPDKLVELLRNG